MTNQAAIPLPSRWARFLSAVTALAEAAEMDSLGYADARIAYLEKRIAALERLPARATSAGEI